MGNKLNSAVLALALAFGGGAEANPLFERIVGGRLLVQFRPGVSAAQIHGILADMQARSSRELPDIGVHVIQLPGAGAEAAYAQWLRARPEVAFAELDRLVPPSDIVPNDPYYSSEWQLVKIQAPSAWTVTTGSPNIVIGITDTGVDSTHPDLSSKIVPGWNVYDNNADTHDIYGHGTKVAGTAASASNNGVGVTSVAWSCLIMPVRISGPDGWAAYSDISDGVLWAANHGARVVNLSYDASTSSTVSSAGKYLAGKGGVLVVAAGNSGAVSSAPDDPNVVAVGATDANDALYSWSNRGANIDLVAPGCVGVTTLNGGSYGGACGTSFSAPLVAGAAALVLSVNPSLKPADVVRILHESSDDLGASGWDAMFGWGRLNASRAVTMAAAGAPPPDNQAPTVAFVAPAAGANLSGVVTIEVAATDNVGIASVSVSANGVALGSDSAAPYTLTWDTAKTGNGAYVLTAVALDASGNQATSSISVAVNNVADTTPPAVSIVSPTSGALISGSVTVSVNTSDNQGVIRTELYVDGVLSASSRQAPFDMKWNTRKALGYRQLLAKAFDAAGNVGLSAPVAVQVTK